VPARRPTAPVPVPGLWGSVTGGRHLSQRAGASCLAGAVAAIALYPARAARRQAASRPPRRPAGASPGK
jgi:hypothetical protein